MTTNTVNNGSTEGVSEVSSSRCRDIFCCSVLLFLVHFIVLKYLAIAVVYDSVVGMDRIVCTVYA